MHDLWVVIQLLTVAWLLWAWITAIRENIKPSAGFSVFSCFIVLVLLAANGVIGGGVGDNYECGLMGCN